MKSRKRKQIFMKNKIKKHDKTRRKLKQLYKTKKNGNQGK